MTIKKIASLAAAGVFAGAVATVGCASAATVTPSGAAATARPAGSIKGAAHLMVYSVNSDGPHFRAIATGAVGDYGPGALFISPKVVEKHVASIFDKLGLAPSDSGNRRVLAAITYLQS